jgi:hypothetical protein
MLLLFRFKVCLSFLFFFLDNKRSFFGTKCNYHDTINQFDTGFGSITLLCTERSRKIQGKKRILLNLSWWHLLFCFSMLKGSRSPLHYFEKNISSLINRKYTLKIFLIPLHHKWVWNNSNLQKMFSQFWKITSFLLNFIFYISAAL